MTTIVRIPADVERSDRLIGPFTARQLAILATTALLLYSVWIATRAVVAPLVFLAAAAPIAAVVTVAIVTRRDGLPADLLLWAAIRHRWRSRHLVTAPEGGVLAAPRWITDRATRARPRPPVPTALSPEELRLPASVTPGGGGVGVIDLGAAGLAVVAVAGTLNLALRTPAEQDGLVGQLAGWLHTLRQPVQILIRSARLDLSAHLTGLHTAASDMSPDLAAAAHDHAAHVSELAAGEHLTRRQVLLIWRESLDNPAAATSPGRRLLGRGRARRG
ncbi:PrgI family protein, partial [Nocardia anaemiae]|uniref:PrgI family protein n=1 Tax=Nocardia anaemiae TaxID=263910 RepID=UPI000AE9655A